MSGGRPGGSWGRTSIAGGEGAGAQQPVGVSSSASSSELALDVHDHGRGLGAGGALLPERCDLGLELGDAAGEQRALRRSCSGLLLSGVCSGRTEGEDDREDDREGQAEPSEG